MNLTKPYPYRGPLCAALSKLYGGQDPYKIVRSFAVDLLFSTGRKSPPFSPLECARSLGLRVEYAPIEAEGLVVDGAQCVALRETHRQDGFFSKREGDGKLHDRLKGPVIVLREPRGFSMRNGRERFTLAHEVGHFVIREALSGFVPVSQFKVDDPEEERLANEFASELLVPKFLLHQDLEQLGFAPDVLLSLAERYQVSLQCLLTCVTRLFRKKVAAVMWEQVDGLYAAGWVSPRRLRNILLCDTGRTSVELALASGRTESGLDSVLFNGRRERWHCVSKKLDRSSKVLTLMHRSKVLEGLKKKNVVRRVVHRSPIPIQLGLPFAEARTPGHRTR